MQSKEIRQYIEKNDLRDATHKFLEELNYLEFEKKKSKFRIDDLRKQVYLIIARLNSLHKNTMSGYINNDSSIVEENKIRKSLLDIVDILEYLKKDKVHIEVRENYTKESLKEVLNQLQEITNDIYLEMAKEEIFLELGRYIANSILKKIFIPKLNDWKSGKIETINELEFITSTKIREYFKDETTQKHLKKMILSWNDEAISKIKDKIENVYLRHNLVVEKFWIGRHILYPSITIENYSILGQNPSTNVANTMAISTVSAAVLISIAVASIFTMNLPIVIMSTIKYTMYGAAKKELVREIKYPLLAREFIASLVKKKIDLFDDMQGNISEKIKENEAINNFIDKVFHVWVEKNTQEQISNLEKFL